MEGSIAVHENSFCPVCKDISVWIVGQNALESVLLREVETASQVVLASLIAALNSTAKIISSARSSSFEVHQNMVALPFREVHSGWRPIKTPSLSINFMHNLLIRSISRHDSDKHQSQNNQTTSHTNISITPTNSIHF